ncbi:MAG TPA: hypothetical protein VGD71_16815, partial [Kribbella sp.]
MREPSKVFVQVGPSDGLIVASAGGQTWTAAGIAVTWSAPGEAGVPGTAGAGDVIVRAAGVVSRVALRWEEPVPSEVLVLG